MHDIVHIDFAKDEKCWNWFGTVYTCIGCGCCSSDITTRRKNRLRVLKSQLEEEYNFDNWFDDPEVRDIQERNIKINIRYLKRQIRYYEKALKGGEE